MFLRFKIQRQRVNTEAVAALTRPVFENMSEVRCTAGADDFGTLEVITKVRAEFDMIGQGFVKTRPTATAVKFMFGSKQRISAGGVNINAVFAKLGIFSGKGSFGSFFAQNTVLFGR